MTNPKSSDSPNMHYFMDDASLIVYVVNNIEDGISSWVYIGSSDNPSYKSALGSFMQNGKVGEGYRIRELL